MWEIQQQGQQLIASAGFQQYEVSAYCRTGYSRHNLNYWQFGDYIGIGAGAHSKITQADGSIWRYWKVKNPRDYLGKEIVLEGKQQIPSQELLLEFLMNAFRLRQKIPLKFIVSRTGLSYESIYSKLQQIPNQDFLTLTTNDVAPTPLGYRFLNELLTAFILN